MHKLFLILLLAFCWAGCTETPPTENAPTPAQASETPGSQTSTASFPTTREELRDRTRQAIEAKDFEALSALVDWADSPPTFRNHQEKMIKSVLDSSENVAAVEIGPPTEGQDSIPPIAMDGQMFELTAPIAGNLNITYKGEDRTNMLPFGESEGQVMILGLRKVGEAAVNAPIRLAMSSTGTVLTVAVNGKPVPGIPENGATDQDIAGFVQRGSNVVAVTWSHPEGAEPGIPPTVTVRRLDPKSGEEVWSEKATIEGPAGSTEVRFEI